MIYVQYGSQYSSSTNLCPTELILYLSTRCQKLIKFHCSSDESPSDHALCELIQTNKHLTNISITGNLISDDTLICISKFCRKIHTLSMKETKITDVGLLYLAEHTPYLIHFDIARCHCVSNEGVRAVLESCIGLTWFNISGCKFVSLELEEEIRKRFGEY